MFVVFVGAATIPDPPSSGLRPSSPPGAKGRCPGLTCGCPCGAREPESRNTKKRERRSPRARRACRERPALSLSKVSRKACTERGRREPHPRGDCWARVSRPRPMRDRMSPQARQEPRPPGSHDGPPSQELPAGSRARIRSAGAGSSPVNFGKATKSKWFASSNAQVASEALHRTR